MASVTAATSKAAMQKFASNLSFLLKNPSTSDFTITWGARQWKVHQAVLQVHSSVFNVWCTRSFRESYSKTADLSKHDEDCVNALITYLYTFDYSDDKKTPQRNETTFNQLLFHTKMVVLADKYDLAPLQTLAVEKFKAQARTSLIVKDFSEATIYASNAMGATKDLRKFIISVAIERQLFSVDCTDSKKTEFEDAMRACADLAVDLNLALVPLIRRSNASIYEEGVELSCFSCGMTFVMDLAQNDSASNQFAYCPSCRQTIRVSQGGR